MYLENKNIKTDLWWKLLADWGTAAAAAVAAAATVVFDS